MAVNESDGLRAKLADIVFGHNGVSVGAPADISKLLDELVVFIGVNRQEGQGNENQLIDQVIAQAFMSQHVFSKVQFDNAKDATQLTVAANENADMLVSAVKIKVSRHVDELLERRLREAIDKSDGYISITLGDGEFTVVKVKEPDTRINTRKEK